MSFSELVLAYLGELAGQRRFSAHTIASYRRDLHDLQSFIDPPAAAGDFRALQMPEIRRFVAQLHARGRGGRSLARTLSAWRGFFRWLVGRGEIAVNPVAGVHAPKSPKALPKVLSPDEAQRLLEARSTDLQEVRDRAMFELFYSSGLRLAELVQLDLDCLADIAQGEVRVLGKRNKPRLIPVGGKACAALAEWAVRRAEWAATEENALFVGRRGARIHRRVVEASLKRRALQQGLSMNVCPHMLRHSFASHVLQSSGDLRAVQEMLGHASIASTQVYTHLDFQHLAKVYDSAHPRARRK